MSSNGTTLAVHENVGSAPIDEIGRTAKMLYMSGYFETANNQAQAIAQLATKILAGRELGYQPFAAVNGIHVIKGKPTLSANLMAAAVKSHPRYDYRVRKMEDEVVSVEFFENGESLGLSQFTQEDAKRAGTQNLTKYPRNMLFARAISNGVRWYCPDVFSGNAVYVPEELSDGDEGGGEESPPVVVVEEPASDMEDVPEVLPDGDADDNPFYDEAAVKAKRQQFAIRVNGVFGGLDETAGRQYLIERWSKKATPDNVRSSTKQLTIDEMDAIMAELKKTLFVERLRQDFENYQAEQADDDHDTEAEMAVAEARAA